MEGITKRLPECEEMVMAAVWDTDTDPDLSMVREFVKIEFNKDWKPQTVSTFLSRLVRRGFLTSYRKGRYTYYEPIVSKEGYCTAELTRMAAVFFEEDVVPLIELCEGRN